MKLKEIKKKEEYKLIKGYFITIKSEKNINKIIKYLTKRNQLPKYLKRIKKEGNKIKCLISLKEDDEFIIINDIKYLIESILLPNRQPKNKTEYKEFKTFWSINYSPLIIKNHFFNELNVYSILNIKSSLFINSFICSTVCLIVDPKSNFNFPFLFTSNNLPWNHSIFKTIKYVSKSEYNYLCTDLEIYIFNDPCFGCCSALIHSRISNVFIIDSNNSNGFNKYFLHENQSLNHNFRVFEVIY